METGQRLLYIAMFVMENGRGWMAVKRQPFAGFVNNSQRVDPRVSCFIDNIMILN